MAVFFTSDTHFGDQTVIINCDRPFTSHQEMDEAMIARWNAVIGGGDLVYHLGDFCSGGDPGAGRYLDRLNGEIHLIEGNHDWETVARHSGRFASISHIKDIVVDGQKVVLCHYPMREWAGAYTGDWHLHGHVHGRLNHAVLGHSMDVGVDCNDFRPWTFQEITEVLKERVTPFADRRAKPVKKTIREPSSPENP